MCSSSLSIVYNFYNCLQFPALIKGWEFLKNVSLQGLQSENLVSLQVPFQLSINLTGNPRLRSQNSAGPCFCFWHEWMISVFHPILTDSSLSSCSVQQGWAFRCSKGGQSEEGGLFPPMKMFQRWETFAKLVVFFFFKQSKILILWEILVSRL